MADNKRPFWNSLCNTWHISLETFIPNIFIIQLIYLMLPHSSHISHRTPKCKL